MFPKALQLVFFWRRNHLPSIAFKCVVWCSLVWICVSVLATNPLANVAAAIIVAMSAIKYSLENLQETDKLKQLCDGDPQMLSELKAKMNTPGVAGTLMREILKADTNDERHGVFEDCNPPTIAELEANRVASTQLIEKMARLVQQFELADKNRCSAVQAELLSMYRSGEYTIEIDELVCEFLPNNVMCIYPSDYVNDDDHASLVDSFSAASNGLWNATDSRSKYDQKNQQWVVSFKEGGVEKIWQSKQSKNKGLSKKFLQQIISYTEAKTGYAVSVLDSQNAISVVCLPSGMYADLVGASADMAA